MQNASIKYRCPMCKIQGQLYFTPSDVPSDPAMGTPGRCKACDTLSVDRDWEEVIPIYKDSAEEMRVTVEAIAETCRQKGYSLLMIVRRVDGAESQVQAIVPNDPVIAEGMFNILGMVSRDAIRSKLKGLFK